MIARILRLPVVMFLACATAGAVMQRLLPLRAGVPSFRAGGIAGGGLFLVATAVAAAAILRMMRRRTTVEPEGQPASLVSDGVFAWSRNPIYVSLILMLFALAIVTDVLWFAIAVPVLWLLLDRVVIPREESVLRATFGDAYAAYRSRVRRWI